jgi:hypothetical protein
MTDQGSGNVWGAPSPASRPTQRWPGRHDAGQLPTRSADTAAPKRLPPGSLQQTPCRTRADLILWAGLALGALLLLLIAFALWDRPVDSSPTVRTTVVSTSETSNAP